MNDSELEDIDLEQEVHLAIEEIGSREKDVQQLVQVSNCLLERNHDLQT
jgi:hypothetical protein